MRIVSLCPSLTELVFALGRGDDLVGVTQFCVRPAAGVATIPKIGGTKNPKIERIVALAPDLVFMNEEENRREDADSLTARQILTHTTFPKTPREAERMVREIGTLLKRDGSARHLADEIDRALVDVTPTADVPRVRYAYLIWQRPYMTINGATYISGLLDAVGGVNVFADATDRYPTISATALRHADPDLIFLATEPFPFAEVHIGSIAADVGIDAAKIVIVDGQLLSWHGASTAPGLRYAASLLRGEAFALP